MKKMEVGVDLSPHLHPLLGDEGLEVFPLIATP
jgi:hypothetical protein